VRSDNALPASDSAEKQRVLVVDDDVNLLRLLGMILRLAGYDVITTEDPILSLDLAAKQSPDLIVLDLQMPKLDGRSVYRELRARGLDVPVMIASAYGARTAQIELGAQASIEKPFEPERLIEAVASLLSAGKS
jgi:DNA-binding response OmpR family regulator